MSVLPILLAWGFGDGVAFGEVLEFKGHECLPLGHHLGAEVEPGQGALEHMPGGRDLLKGVWLCPDVAQASLSVEDGG